MITALDTNVILSLFNQERTARHVGWNLELARKEGSLVIAPVVYAELSAHPAFTQQAIGEFLQNTGIQVTWDLGEACWKLTALAHRHHWEQRRKSGDKNKIPKRPVADTLIGAHASVHADRLFTMNVEDYRARFPDLSLQDPSLLPLLDHSTVEKETTDTPLKTQVAWRVQVNPPHDEILLEHLLVTLYQQTLQSTGFQHHNSPNAVFIWVYASEDTAKHRGEAWLATIRKSAAQQEPQLEFNARLIHQANQPGAGAYTAGLFEDERKTIFVEVARAERESMRRAEQEVGGVLQARFTEVREELLNQLLEELCLQHHMNREELEEIRLEGISSGWPLPDEPRS